MDHKSKNVCCFSIDLWRQKVATRWFCPLPLNWENLLRKTHKRHFYLFYKQKEDIVWHFIGLLSDSSLKAYLRQNWMNRNFCIFSSIFISACPPPILGIPDFHCQFSWHYRNSRHVSSRVLIGPAFKSFVYMELDGHRNRDPPTGVAHWINTVGTLLSSTNYIQIKTYGHIKDCRSNLHHQQKTICAATWQNQQNGCAPNEDSDQLGHPSSLIRVFAVRMKKAWVLNYPLSAQRRLRSDWADAQADLSLRWAHTHFVGFVMSRLIC